VPNARKRKPRMIEILLAYKKLKENATAQAYTFAIRTSQRSNPKLQKSMLFSQRSVETTEFKVTLKTNKGN